MIDQSDALIVRPPSLSQSLVDAKTLMISGDSSRRCFRGPIGNVHILNPYMHIQSLHVTSSIERWTLSNGCNWGNLIIHCSSRTRYARRQAHQLHFLGAAKKRG